MRVAIRLLVSATFLLAASIIWAQGPPIPDLGLVGNRFPPLKWEDMTPEQKAMVEHLLEGPRNSLGGPFNIMLRSPEIGDLAQEFGGKLRFLDTMPVRLRELAIIITARYWTAQFEWTVHRAAAERSGVSKEIIEAIRQGKRPQNMADDEVTVYQFASEILENHQVSDQTFAAAKDLLGERGVVELTTLIGYYQLVSMLLNVDEYPLPAGVQPELAPLPN